MDVLTRLLNSKGSINQWLVNKAVAQLIPFNKPHGFKMSRSSDGFIKVLIPFSKKNKNHLNGVHACAMATGGELAARLNLIKEFSPKKYRLIMSELRVEYHKQGKSDLMCSSSLNNEIRDEIQAELKNEGVHFIEMQTYLKDKSNQLIATVTTNWQLKDWKQIKKKK